MQVFIAQLGEPFEFLPVPAMDGYALTEDIRKIEAGANRQTPISAITASDFDLSAEKARQ